jgi:uncharacterized membrane protein
METIIALIVLALVVGLLVLPIVAVAMLNGIRRRLTEMAERQEELNHDLEVVKRCVRGSETPAAPREPAPAAAMPPVPPPIPVTVRVSPAPPPAAPLPPPALRPAPPPPRPAAAPVFAPAAVETREPSKLAEPAREILRKMWSWLLYGEEKKAEGVSVEYAIATTWLLRIGIVALVLCVVYFLRWSIQKGLLTPPARVGMCIVAGIAMLVGGLRLLGRKYHLIGQGFIGGGLLALYFSVYAAGPSMFRLLPTPAVFGLMILVTLTAGLLSVRTDSLLTALLGLAGGYLTPVLIRTPTPNLPGLYAYVLLLGLGLLGVAWRKQWRLLNYVGFVCTYALFAASLEHYHKATDFPVAMSFLTAFFVVHSAIAYVHNFLRKRRSTTLEVMHLAANALLYAGAGYWLIQDAYGRPYPALLALGLALFFLLHVLVFLRRGVADRALLVALLALAGGFTVWTLPLLMEKEKLTIAFALLAFMFLWMGRRMGSQFLQALAQGLYLFVFGRLLLLDLPDNFGHTAAPTSAALYWRQMVERLWVFGASIASVLAAFFLQARRSAGGNGPAGEPGKDMPAVVPARAAATIFGWFAVLFSFLFLHLELNAMFGALYPPVRLPVLTALWCAAAAGFLAVWLAGAGPRATVALATMIVFLTGAVVKLFAVDVGSWRLDARWFYDMDYALLPAAMRLLDFGLVLALLWVVWSRLRGSEREANPAPIFGYAGLGLLWVYATLEINSLLHWKLRDFQGGGVTVLWALFAIAFIVGGIWQNVRTLRYTGLALAAVVVAKIFLFDLADMPVIYRVLAFMALGVVLVLGSFAYIHSSRKFTKEEGTETDA